MDVDDAILVAKLKSLAGRNKKGEWVYGKFKGD
jgi:hypothetical protein